MKCCDVKAGDLRTLVTIERRTATPDGVGGFTEAWAADPAGGAWAKVEAAGGIMGMAAAMSAGRVSPSNTYKITVRFRGDGNGAPYWSANDRVIVNGREYGIMSVVDPDGRRKFIQIIAQENRAT